MKQGELFQIDKIIPFLRVTFGKDGHSAADNAAGLFHKGFQRREAFTGGDHIVHKKDSLALHELGIRTVQIQMLLLGGGDGLHGDAEDIPHVKLGAFPGEEILFVPILPRHFVGERNALCFGGDQVVVFRRLCKQLLGACNGQFRVAKNYETGNGQCVRYRADGKIPLETGNAHMMVHGNRSFIHISIQI